MAARTILNARLAIAAVIAANRMFEGKAKLKLLTMRRTTTLLLVVIGCLLLSSPNLADVVPLPEEHGYMLIRLKLTPRERVGMLAMSSVDADHAIKIRRKSFEPAGVNAWIALVAMPSGRYFLSEYQPMFGIVGEEAQRLNRRHRRSAPNSDLDTFQIAPGVVNYVGDWTMRVETSRRGQLNPIIEFDKATLERYVSQYAEYSNKYQIYLSPMGQDAISLVELAKTTEQ